MGKIAIFLWVSMVVYITYHFAGVLWNNEFFKITIAIIVGYLIFTAIKLSKF